MILIINNNLSTENPPLIKRTTKKNIYKAIYNEIEFDKSHSCFSNFLLFDKSTNDSYHYRPIRLIY